SDEALRQNIKDALVRHGHAVREAFDPAGILGCVRERWPDLVLIGGGAQGWRGPGGGRGSRRGGGGAPPVLIVQASHAGPRAQMVYIGEEGGGRLAVEALRAGSPDYLKPPLSVDELVASVERCLRDAFGEAAPASRGSEIAGPQMIGETPLIRSLIAYIRKVATTDSNVLITGETGTGKELVAELVHRHSARCRQPLVRINCAAIPDGLL